MHQDMLSFSSGVKTGTFGQHRPSQLQVQLQQTSLVVNENRWTNRATKP
jgi:hypothetical protein